MGARGASEPQQVRQVLGGRYVLCGEIAAGGMATVYSGRMIGPSGFSRIVAIKRLHAQYARDPEFVTMFVDEIRMTSHIAHPNVVPTIDVVADGGELSLIMEYVAGESLARLRQMAYKKGWRVPPHISTAIMSSALYGLHAAHEATDDRGRSLGLVHRDVSPQNILIGVDGSVKMVDFGVAKAAGRMQMTRAGQLKGKVAYMSPEQVSGQFPVSPQSDVFAAGVVLWELLTGKRLFKAASDMEALQRILTLEVPPPSRLSPDLPASFDAVTMRALERDPSKRFVTAREMAESLERDVPKASRTDIGEWVEFLAGDIVSRRSAELADLEVSAENLRVSGARPLSEGDESAPVQRPRPSMELDSPVEVVRPRPSRPGPPGLAPSDGDRLELRREILRYVAIAVFVMSLLIVVAAAAISYVRGP